jgi:hypothetical protein
LHKLSIRSAPIAWKTTAFTCDTAEYLCISLSSPIPIVAVNKIISFAPCKFFNKSLEVKVLKPKSKTSPSVL